MLDEVAFSEAYLRYRKPLLTHVLSRVADPEVAAELVQEVFLRAYRLRGTYSAGTARISTWLWMIARTTTIDYLRGQSPRSETGVDEIPATTLCAERSLLKKDRRKGMLKILRTLTRPQRKVYFLRVMRRLSYEEIAHRMNLSVSSVKNLAYRARRSLVTAHV